MIVTEIYNGQGLGNQLACYVTTRVLAIDKNYEFGIMNPHKLKCKDFMTLDPMGSTNFGKLTNVSIVPEASSMAITASSGNSVSGSGMYYAQTFEFITTCINNNIIRVSGGKPPGVPPTVSCQKRCDNSFLGKQCKLSPPISSLMIECM